MRRAVVVAVAAIVMTTVGDGAAGAQSAGAEIAAVGWWTDVPVTSAPEGGIAVGQGAGGPSSVAALSLVVGEEPPTTATLKLVEADGVRSDGAALQVCTTPNAWEPVAGGPMEDAPKPECELGSVELERAEDGSWSGDVASLLDDTDVSLMVVPAEPAPEEPPPAPFQVSFDPPAIDAPAPPASSGSSSSARPATATPPASAPAPTQTPTPTPPTTAASVPAPPTGGDEPVAVGPSSPVPTRGDGGGDGRPWQQALFFLVVAAVVGAAAGVGKWQLRVRGIAG